MNEPLTKDKMMTQEQVLERLDGFTLVDADDSESKLVFVQDVLSAVMLLREKMSERKKYLVKLKPNDMSHQLCIAATISELIMVDETISEVFGGCEKAYDGTLQPERNGSPTSQPSQVPPESSEGRVGK